MCLRLCECARRHTHRITYFISFIAVGQWRYLFLVRALCFLPFGFLYSPFIAFGVYIDSLFSFLTLIIIYFFSSYFSVLVLVEMPFAKLQPFCSLEHCALTFSPILPGHKPSVAAPLVTKGFPFLTFRLFLWLFRLYHFYTLFCWFFLKMFIHSAFD